MLPGVRDEAAIEGERISKRQQTSRHSGERSQNRALELLESGQKIDGIDGLQSPAPFASGYSLVRKEGRSALAPHYFVRVMAKGDGADHGNPKGPREITSSLQSRDGVGGSCSMLQDMQYDGQLQPLPLSLPCDVVNCLGLVDDTVAAVTDSAIRRAYFVLQSQGDTDKECATEIKTNREHSPEKQPSAECSTKRIGAGSSRGSATQIAHEAEAMGGNCDREVSALPVSATRRSVSLLHHGASTVPKEPPVLGHQFTASTRRMNVGQATRKLSVGKPMSITSQALFNPKQERELTEGLGNWAREVVIVGQLLDTNRLQVAECLQGVKHGEFHVRQRLERHVGATVQTLPLSFLKGHGYRGEAQSRGLKRARGAMVRQAARIRACAWQR